MLQISWGISKRERSIVPRIEHSGEEKPSAIDRMIKLERVFHRPIRVVALVTDQADARVR